MANEQLVISPGRGPKRNGLMIDAVLDLDTSVDGVARGALGVRFQPYGCPEGVLMPVNVCEGEDYQTLIDGVQGLPSERALPAFTVAAIMGCSTLSNMDAEISARLRSDFGAFISPLVTTAFLEGTDGASGFSDIATSIGAADNADEVFEAAEWFLGDRLMGAAGWIFIHPWMLGPADKWLQYDGNRISTKSGHRVVADPGVPFDEAHVSSPVALWMTQPQDVTGTMLEALQAGDRSRNLYNQILAAHGVFAYDSCGAGSMTVAVGATGFPRPA